ncbi:MAG: glycosyltransferase family 2 protein, partial [Bacilli bacterium]|nr:glycosyltransferase family 2 protein [Bacilli bacterium]
MKLSAVVVFYNPTDVNIKNIDNYKNSVDKIYVVDNSDDDVERMKSSNKIEYVKLGENKGIAYALNIGAKKAIEDGYKFLLTMDQDSKITDDIVDKMKEFIKNNKDSKIGLISPYHDINTDDPKEGKVEERIEVMTSGNIIYLDAYQEIGGYKDWLFIDCVDTEYCMNLNKHGYKVIRLNEIIMKHELGNLVVHKLFGKEYPCYNHNPMRRYYIVRNNLYINQMYGDIYPDYCKRLLRIQKGQVKRIIAFEKNKLKKLSMMYKGYKDFK